jgi:HK97 family phage portal protein
MLSPVTGGRWVTVFDSFSGAWQQNVALDQDTVLRNTAVFACIRQIANDIAKLPINLIEPLATAPQVWLPTENAAHSPLLRKPNWFQTRFEFVSWWLCSLLIDGNTYVLKKFDPSGIVRKLIVLNPTLVTVLVSESGDVFYRCSTDHLSGVFPEDGTSVTIPARFIIHHKYLTLNHPLIGCSPLQVAGLAATANYKITEHAKRFYTNFARPAGVLEAPEDITDEQAQRLKERWDEFLEEENAGRILVLEQGLKFNAMTVKSTDAQMIETLKWTAEDVCNAFGVPAWKIGAAGAAAPNSATAEAREQMYYSSTLQPLIEGMELLLDEGLQLPKNLGVEFDLWHLLRLDTASRYTAYSEAIKGAWMAPNEARAREGMAPKAGGDALYMQQQNYSLEALAKRDAQDDPFGTNAPSALPAPAADEQDDDEERALLPVTAPYDAARTYKRGELCTRAGSTYQLQVNSLTGVAPGTPDVHAWAMFAKGGRNGKDGANWADATGLAARVADIESFLKGAK